jgi:26S proteasome regulatory subunit N1
LFFDFITTGTGNVLKIQKLLHICSEHFENKEGEEKEKSKDSKDKDKDKDKKEEEKEDDGSHQGIAVLGIALIAMAEEIGTQMALRAFNHLVR